MCITLKCLTFYDVKSIGERGSHITLHPFDYKSNTMKKKQQTGNDTIKNKLHLQTKDYKILPAVRKLSVDLHQNGHRFCEISKTALYDSFHYSQKIFAQWICRKQGR